MKKLQLVMVFIFFGLLSVNAQSKETKEKLKNLNSDVEKITITTSDDEIEISGEDALKLVNKMIAENHFMVKKMHHGKKGKNMVFFEKGDNDKDCKEIKINVEVDDNDSGKVIIIKKTIDGKETVQEFKGEDALKFIEENGDEEHGIKFISEDGEKHVVVNLDDDDIHWISDENADEIDKKVEVEINDGVKKVTVTTTENGDKNVEVFEGEEAEEYLEKMKEEKELKMIISDDGENKILKKKIIIIEEEDDDEHAENDND